jgi:hypothetical protein
MSLKIYGFIMEIKKILKHDKQFIIELLKILNEASISRNDWHYKNMEYIITQILKSMFLPKVDNKPNE